MGTTTRSLGKGLWIGLFALRALNAVFVQTYFDPDEYWQTIEVAHHAVFSYGWLSWEWTVGLRSILSLLPFMAYFQILRLLSVDSDIAVASVAATCDYLVYRLALRIFRNEKIAETTVYLMLSNFWNFAYSTRTLSNNIETMLILMSLLYLPMGIKQSKPRTTLGVCLMGLSILNRPSAITHWIVPLARLLHSWTGLKSRLFIRAIISAGLVTLFGVLIDSLYYEKLTLSWWNFVQFNFFQGISEFYGTSPWHYHLVQTIPIMGNTALPLVLYAFSSKTDLAFILQFLAGSVFFNSLLPHKEFRFLSPIAPFLMLLAGLGYWMLFGNWNRRLRMALLVFIVVSNVVAGVYLTRVHQSGVIKVMDHLRTEIDNGVVKGIHFAMPCHSTPFYGYLHRNVPMTFVTCHPPVGLPKDKYLDESDIFQKEPAVHLSQAINQTISHVVIFEELLSRPNIKNSLHAFQLCWRVFNSHWNPDQRRTGDVLVYCRRQ